MFCRCFELGALISQSWLPYVSKTTDDHFEIHFHFVVQKRKVRKMHIMKGASGLGLRIVGGKGSKYGDMGVFVRDLEEGGAAHKCVRPCPHVVF